MNCLLTLRHRVQPGCRVVAPLGARKLTGFVLRVHDAASDDHSLREVLSLTDEEPVLDRELLALAQWIAEYYCAPLGEVLKGMLPLGGETRRSTQYALTDSGRQVARQLILRPESDAALRLLAMLEERARTASQLTAKIPNARTLVRGLMQRGWVVAEEKEEERDPLRASAERLEAEFLLPRRRQRQTQKSRARTAGIFRVASRPSQSRRAGRQSEDAPAKPPAH